MYAKSIPTLKEYDSLTSPTDNLKSTPTLNPSCALTLNPNNATNNTFS